MKEKDDEPIFGRWDMFFLGICLGSALGNVIFYFLLDYLIQ